MKTKHGTSTKSLFGSLGLAALLVLATAGCKSNASQAPIVNGNAGMDPAAANMAPPSSTGQPSAVLATNASYTPQQSSESYNQQTAPVEQQYPDQQSAGGDQDYAYNAPPANYDDNADAQYEYATQAPPPLPEYDQPPAPDPNYLWTPGYWAWGPDGYYWVPGVWCAPPYYGALWTPPYWGYYGGRYAFHHGYWGLHVGFYGGINYGFGYIGIGFFGGYWRGHDFYYNRSVTNVGHVPNVYNRTVVYDGRTYGAHPSDRVSYNGGHGGLNVRPQQTELAAAREPHAGPERDQLQVRQQSAQNRQQFYSANKGRPAQAAVARPVSSNHSIAEPNREVQQVQQRSAEVQQQRNQQMQQRNGQQQHNVQEQQRNVQEQQHNQPAQQQQRAVQQQQQQRNVQEQQHTQQVQQQQQQRNVQEQQRNQQLQQHNVQQQEQQRNVQQQHTVQQQQVQQRAAQQQQVQQRAVQQQQQRAVQQQQQRPVEAARPASQAPRAAPQEAPRAAPAPRAAAPAPHEAPHEEGGHPR
jgi:hypothetical protein